MKKILDRLPVIYYLHNINNFRKAFEMGLRTVVIFNNDHLDEIKNDPEFAKKLYDAIMKQNNTQATAVVETDHATVATISHCSHSLRNISLRVIGFKAHEIYE